MNFDDDATRQNKVLRMLWDSWTSFDNSRVTTMQHLMVSRSEVAEYLPCSKTLSSQVLDGMVRDGLMRKEPFKLTKSPRDKRWHWLYSLTQDGCDAAEATARHGVMRES